MAYVRPVHVLYNDNNIMNAVHFTIMHACMYLVLIMCHMHDFFPVVLCILSVHIPCRECANG